MITSTTPYKLTEIIKDTWPQLYNPPKQPYNGEKDIHNERILDHNKQTNW